MRPMIDDLELPQVQEIVTADRRILAERRPPGMDGSVLQNLGRRSTTVVVRGVATGPGAAEFVEKLDGKFRAGTALPFTADVVTDGDAQQVLIDDLAVEEVAGRPERFAYVLTLVEHVEPAKPSETAGLDTGILDEAKDLTSGLIDGLDVARDLATGLERFVPVFSDLLQRLRNVPR
jgi:hypothetical protein